ncbi:hypothetical protein D9M70_329980 [compost metagenome]
MDARSPQALLQQRQEAVGALHAVALGTVGLGIQHEVRVAVVQAEVGEAHVRLLPADHAVAIVAQDDHREVHLQAHRGFQLLAVHHEAAIAAHRDDGLVRIDHVGGHGRRQAGAHGRQGVVQQHGVGHVRLVVAGEPDLVHAVVQGDDALRRQRPAHVGDQPLRVQREARIVGAFGDLGLVGLADRQQAGEVPVRGVGERLADLPDGVGDVAHHLDLREVHRVDLGGTEVHVDHLGAAADHEERRLLDHVVADVDDQVGRFQRAVHEVAGRQRGVAEEARVALVHHALAHLGGDEGNAGAVDQLLEDLGGHLAVGPGADHQDRAARGLQLVHRGADHLVLGQRAAAEAARDRQAVGLLGGDVLGQFQVHGAGLLLLGEAEGLTHPRGDIVGRGQLVGVLGQRLHHADHVEDLETPLLGLLDRLLAGDHQHRHAAEIGVGAGGDQVGGAGAEGRKAHAGLAGQAAVGGGHEARRLLVAGEHQPDLRLAQGFEQVEVLFAGNAEDVLDTFALQALHYYIGGLGHLAATSGMVTRRDRTLQQRPAPVVSA